MMQISYQRNVPKFKSKKKSARRILRKTKSELKSYEQPFVGDRISKNLELLDSKLLGFQQDEVIESDVLKEHLFKQESLSVDDNNNIESLSGMSAM